MWKQLKGEKALPCAGQMSQAVFSQLPPDLPQDSGASHEQRSASSSNSDFISPNFQKQQLQKRLFSDQHQDGGPVRIQVSLDLLQAQGRCPGVCHTPDKKVPLQPSVCAGGSSQDSPKVKAGHTRKGS